MNHFTVITEDLPRTLDFYVGVLGLTQGPRPDLGFAGAWLYADGRPILHVYADRRVPPGVAGVIDHMAFSARGLREVKGRLEARGLKYDLSHYRSREQARSDVFDYIERFYNPTRRHSTLGYVSPIEFEKAQEA